LELFSFVVFVRKSRAAGTENKLRLMHGQNPHFLAIYGGISEQEASPSNQLTVKESVGA
jgi:hypothetical protein